MESIWKKTAELPEFHTLTKDIRTKVLIIGGGMAGILCAYFLQRSGVDYCLLEADTICGGVTIGDGSVIGAGSVVTKDIPAGVLAFGNPCRVQRALTEQDSMYRRAQR